MIFDGNEQEMSMRALFLLAAGLCLIATFLALRWVPEPDKKVDRNDIDPKDIDHIFIARIEKARYLPQKIMYTVEVSSKNLRWSNFSPALQRYYAIMFLAFSGFLSFYVALPIFLSQYIGLSNPEVFVVYLASAIASALTYGFMGRQIEKRGGKRIQMACFAARIVIFPSFFLVTMLSLGSTELFVLLLVLHAGAGLCWAGLSVAGHAIVGKLAYKNFRTQSLGMYNAVQGSATIIGSLLGGFVAGMLGYEALFLLASVFIAICAGAFGIDERGQGTGRGRPGRGHVIRARSAILLP